MQFFISIITVYFCIELLIVDRHPKTNNFILDTKFIFQDTATKIAFYCYICVIIRR